MYQSFSRCNQPAVAKDAGWPTESAVSVATRSGNRAAVTQAKTAPPVVADEVRPLDLQVVEQADDVADDEPSGV